jgi:hypothetical protein
LRAPAQLERALRGLCQRTLDGEHDIVGGERRSVVELHSGTQLEAPRPCIHRLPGHRQRGLELEVAIASDQRLIDLRGDARLVQQRERMRIHALRVERARQAQRPCARRHHRGERKQPGRDQQASDRRPPPHAGAILR